jgi:hypothetical protein
VLSAEDTIIWVEPCEKLQYRLRQSFAWTRTRRGPLTKQGAGRVVAYAVLKPDAVGEGGRFSRRVFWVSARSELSTLADVVDARTVGPGVIAHPPRSAG